MAPQHVVRGSRLLGWGGLMLAVSGAVAIIVAGANVGIATGILLPLLSTAALAILPGSRDQPTIWLITAVWTGVIGVISIFSVGIIFLSATIFLLAAYITASR